MIKTYRYNDTRNTVSHILPGKNGVTVRFNFERGNVVTKRKPELILKNKYYQDLLENSDLFKQHVVELVSSIAEPSDVIADANSEQKKQEPTEEVKGIRSADEVIAYVNERFGKDYRTLAKAMNQASKAGIIFPDYNE